VRQNGSTGAFFQPNDYKILFVTIKDITKHRLMAIADHIFRHFFAIIIKDEHFWIEEKEFTSSP
jgi:hypothetical protein